MLQLAEFHCKQIIKLCDYSIYSSTYVYVLGDLIHAAQYMVIYHEVTVHALSIR